MMKLLLLATLASTAFAARVLVNRQVPTGIRNEANSRILKLESDADFTPEGSYKWAYETENGISADEAGQQIKSAGTGDDAGGTSAQGSYQYTNPEGELVQQQYVADENGFQPQGSHIPTPPPIPDSIAKALSYNAAHPSEDVQPNERASIPSIPSYSAQRPREQASYSPVGSYTLGG